jgi:hypothetical protein
MAKPAQSRVLISFAFSMLLAWSCGPSAAEGLKVEATRKMPGSVLPATEVKAAINPGETFTVSYVTVDPRMSKIGIALPEDLEAGGASLERLFFDNQALAIVSGGFLENYIPATPAGLVQKDRKLLNGPKKDRILSGLVCFSSPGKGGPVAILPLAKGLQSRAEYSDCLQSGPLLVYEGKPFADLEAIDNDEDSPKYASRQAERAFVAIVKGGRIIMGVSTRVSLFALRELMLLSKEEDGLEAISVIGLAGGRTAGTIVRGTPHLKEGITAALLPNAIFVRR